MLKLSDLFDIDKCLVSEYLYEYKDSHPWEVLPNIKFIIEEFIKSLKNSSDYHSILNEYGDYIIHGSSKEGYTLMHKSSYRNIGIATFEGYNIIGPNCEIRSGAFLRGNVIVSSGCVIGNSCEFKNCILFNNSQVPHFNYVGDSILGYKSHLGAGVKLSNLRFDNKNVKIDGIDTGLRKCGSFIGDGAQIGCNSVLNPGAVIGRNSIIYPNMTFSGTIGDNKSLKLKNIFNSQYVEIKDIN